MNFETLDQSYPVMLKSFQKYARVIAYINRNGGNTNELSGTRKRNLD